MKLIFNLNSDCFKNTVHELVMFEVSQLVFLY